MSQDEERALFRPAADPNPKPEVGSRAPAMESYRTLESTRIFTRGEIDPAPPVQAPVASFGGTQVLSRGDLAALMPSAGDVAPPSAVPSPPLPSAPPGAGRTQVMERPILSVAAAPKAAPPPGFSATRVLPIEEWMASANRAPLAPAPAAARPFAPPPPPDTAVTEMEPMPGLLQPRRGVRARVTESWRGAPATRKLTWALLPLALPAAAFAVLGPNAQQPASAARRAPVKVSAVPSARPGAQAATPTKPLVLPPLRAGQTLERAAADAVAEGNHALAVAYYRELAAREPERLVYRAAVRVLEAKLVPAPERR